MRLTEFTSQEGRVLWVSAPGLDRELYVSALGDAGFATVVVETALAATDWLAGGEAPDVIVMDLLPEPDQAWALVEHAATQSCTAPVVIFTSLIRPGRGIDPSSAVSPSNQ